MLGAVIGDIVGSVYEWNNYKGKDFSLFSPDCRMTDDSVMTAAVASLLLMGRDGSMEDLSRKLVGEMRFFGRLYPHQGYGPRFENWLREEHPAPYGSYGNGSGMRVSPVGWAARSIEECLALAEATARVSHDHPDGIAGAKAIAGCVYLARTGEDKELIRIFAEEFYSLDFTLDEIREDYTFDVSCAGSVPQAIVAFLESCSFEDAVRNAVSIGGDSDTIAAMAGAIAEGYYGIPRAIKEQALPFVTGQVRKTYARFFRRYGGG